jgi:hypothetical protein
MIVHTPLLFTEREIMWDNIKLNWKRNASISVAKLLKDYIPERPK